MKIGIDMMGGDYAPLEAVKGISLFIAEQGDPASLVLLGDEAQISPLLESHGLREHGLKVVHAPQVIDMHEHPTKALKEKTQSSIAIGFH